MNSPVLLRALAAAALVIATSLPVHAKGVSGGGGGGGGGGSSSSDAPVAGEILLKLASSSALQPLLARYPLTLLASLGSRPVYRVKVIGTASVANLIPQLLLEPGVHLAEPNQLNQSPEARKNIAWAIGSEVAYRAQWAPQAIHLPEAQSIASGTGVRVAVLDTGVDLRHPALAGRLLPGRDFVDGDTDPSEGGTPADAAWGHGTHVAGIVALVAPGAKIIPVRVLDASGGADMWTILQGMVWALDPDGDPSTDDGAHVINLSMGSLQRTQLFDTLQQVVACNPPADGVIFDTSDAGYESDRLRCGAGNGAVVVAAAGNDSSDKIKEYPAAESVYGLVSVAASDATRRVAKFSNSGGWIHAAAPGDGITSTIPGGGYATWSGTSMAAPVTAGALALLRSLDLSVTPKLLARQVSRTSALMCGTPLRQLDALALVIGSPLPDTPCP